MKKSNLFLLGTLLFAGSMFCNESPTKAMDGDELSDMENNVSHGKKSPPVEKIDSTMPAENLLGRIKKSSSRIFRKSRYCKTC